MSLRAGSNRRSLRNIVIHASFEALHQVIATTKVVRAVFPVDQQSEETHVWAWPLAQDREFVLCSCSVFKRVMEIQIYLFARSNRRI